jgi:hypothetical protein
MFFLCRILCRRLTSQRIREASPNLFNDRCRSKSEKGHTPVNATVNLADVGQCCAWHERVPSLVYNLSILSFLCIGGSKNGWTRTWMMHQEKPHLLICSHKLECVGVYKKSVDISCK